MKTTYNELQKLFRLKDERQIKPGLFNRIKVIDENNIEVLDDKLKILLKRFKTSEVLTIEEVSEKYEVSPTVVVKMIKESRLPFYQLSNTKGSKYLFFESELNENEMEITLFCGIRKNLFKFFDIVEVLMKSLLENEKIKEVEMEIFRLYYCTDLDTDKIAEKVDLTSTRILQIINKNNKLTLNYIRSLISYKKQNEDYKKKYEELKKDGFKILKVPKEFKITKIPYPLKTKINELGLSVRTKNCLKNKKIETVFDLFDFMKDNKIDYISKAGKKTKLEIENFIELFK